VRQPARRVELGEGSYVEIRHKNYLTVLEIGWVDEGMSAVWLTPESVAEVCAAMSAPTENTALPEEKGRRTSGSTDPEIGDTSWASGRPLVVWRERLWDEVHRIGGPRKSELVKLGRDLDSLFPEGWVRRGLEARRKTPLESDRKKARWEMV
jgi:hypothetical protein